MTRNPDKNTVSPKRLLSNIICSTEELVNPYLQNNSLAGCCCTSLVGGLVGIVLVIKDLTV